MNLPQDGRPAQGCGPGLADILGSTVAPPTSFFRQLWDLGYRRLVPVVPPTAFLSERSSMAARVRAGKDPRGKVPGIRNSDGTWSGLADWAKHECSPADLERWAGMKASVGIRTGEQPDGTWLVGVDADTTNQAVAADVAIVVRRFFGSEIPTRVGNAPKALYVARFSGPVSYSREEFDDGTATQTSSGAPNWPRVEFLSDGKQFVAHGIHPGTGRPYEWTVPLVPFADLPIRDPAELA